MATSETKSNTVRELSVTGDNKLKIVETTTIVVETIKDFAEIIVERDTLLEGRVAALDAKQHRIDNLDAVKQRAIQELDLNITDIDDCVAKINEELELAP